MDLVRSATLSWVIILRFRSPWLTSANRFELSVLVRLWQEGVSVLLSISRMDNIRDVFSRQKSICAHRCEPAVETTCDVLGQLTQEQCGQSAVAWM